MNLNTNTNNNSLVWIPSINAPNAMPTSISFFSRTFFYTSLVIIDAYLFRPLFQQENERLSFCKFGAVLLSSWPWCFLFWGFLVAIQATKAFYQMQPAVTPPSSSSSTSSSLPSSYISPMGSSAPMPPSHPANNNNNNNSPVVSVQDLDVMEAFRLAKQQYMGGKGAN